MIKYRGKTSCRPAHPKIFIWSHTEKAEIQYFQAYKNYLRSSLLMPGKKLCWAPHELLEKTVEWKKRNINESDGDQVWCIFDVDDFYKDDRILLLRSIKKAEENGIKIAYVNECFELWILMHFEKPTTPISRGSDIEKRIQKLFVKNNLGNFTKNQDVFNVLLPFLDEALKNAKKTIASYEDIDWEVCLSEEGNPSTSIHCLIEEIITL
jgi:hypothetical protein